MFTEVNVVVECVKCEIKLCDWWMSKMTLTTFQYVANMFFYICTYIQLYVSDTRAIRFAIPADSVTLMALGHLWHVSRN